MQHSLTYCPVFCSKSSYASLVPALTNGDWSTNPTERIENQKKSISGYTNLQAIPEEDNYKRELKNWFNQGFQAAEQHGIPFTILKFEELISSDFNISNLVENLFHDPS